jgi:parallel beta-helix repeat protein
LRRLQSASERVQIALVITMLFLLPSFVSVIPSFVEPAHSTTRIQYSEVLFTPAQTGVDPPLLVDSDAEMANLGLPGDGSPSNPYIIEGLNISAESPCIRITEVSASFVIRDCFLRASAGTCLRFLNVSDGRVEDCVLIGTEYAVYCQASSGVHLSGNTIYDAGYAIYILDSRFCSISGSTIYACSVGISFQSARNSSCVDNTIYGNSGTGVDISADSLNNTFVTNVLGWNSQGTLGWGNSIDRGNNNTWAGNFWSDYSPPGPYNLSGSAGAQDHEPRRLIDNDIPVLNHTDQVLMAEGADTQIVWRTSDQFPLEYRISVDGNQQTEATWTQTEISYDLSYLPVGTHEVVLRLEDASGLEAFHTVTVRVLFIFLSDIGTELVVLASIASVFSVVLVLLAVKKRL